jgi:hypothetical protein
MESPPPTCLEGLRPRCDPKPPDEDFNEAIRIAQAEFDKHWPQVVVGSSRGGALAMIVNIGENESEIPAGCGSSCVPD